MSDSSHIEWTDLFPVSPQVARDTEGLNVDPVNALVAKEVVVLPCGQAAIKARKRNDRREPPPPYFGSNGVHGCLVNLSRGSWQQSSAAHLDSPTVDASRCEAIVTAAVSVITDGIAPRLASCTAFQTGLNGHQVCVDVEASLASRHLNYAFNTSHMGTRIPRQ